MTWVYRIVALFFLILTIRIIDVYFASVAREKQQQQVESTGESTGESVVTHFVPVAWPRYNVVPCGCNRTLHWREYSDDPGTQYLFRGDVQIGAWRPRQGYMSYFKGVWQEAEPPVPPPVPLERNDPRLPKD